MKLLILLASLLALPVASYSQVKALVGGTLIDGFGGTPIRNSVVLIDGDKITSFFKFCIEREDHEGI